MADMFIMINVCAFAYAFTCAWGFPTHPHPVEMKIVRRKVDIKEHYADVTHSPTRTLGDVKSLKMQ